MSSVETVNALERRINASIPQKSIHGDVTERLKRMGRNAKVAGFRPGKVPVKVLEQYYGAQARQEILGDAMQRSFADAIYTNKLKVAGSPQFEIVSTDLSADPVEFSATFEVYPEIVMGDLAEQNVEQVLFELSQADVDKTIETLRKQRGAYEKVDRAAQNDDQVMIDFSGKHEGVAFEGGDAKDLPVVLGVGRMLPDFEAAIIGMNAGDEKTFDMTFPDDYHGKEVAGKKVNFTVTLQAVAAMNLPTFDADFAIAMGVEDGSVDKLTEEIRSNLEREVTRRLKAKNKEASMDALIAVAQFEVPKSLVDSESQVLMQQAAEEMESRGMKGKDIPMYPEMFAERAVKRVKLGLMLADLVSKQDLKAAPEQIRSFVEDYAQSFDDPAEVISWYYADQSRLKEVEGLVLEENVAVWVLAQGKSSEKTVTFDELMGS
jgi:trigger factor